MNFNTNLPRLRVLKWLAAAGVLLYQSTLRESEGRMPTCRAVEPHSSQWIHWRLLTFCIGNFCLETSAQEFPAATPFLEGSPAQTAGGGLAGGSGGASRPPSFVCIRVIKRKREAQGLSSPDRLFPESESGLQSSKWDRPGYWKKVISCLIKDLQ